MASPEESLALIKANLAEILNEEIIDDVILNQKRHLKVYWGTAPTGRPHCGYFVPMMKIAELLQAGCEVKRLLADLHAVLDNMKSTFELVALRCVHYERAIRAMMAAIGVDVSRLIFVKGDSFQLTKEYTLDNFRLMTLLRVGQAQRAGAEVVKQSDDPPLSGLVYPGMQALDEEYLGVDAQFGGVDQRKIFVLALETLPRMGMRKRAHLMNPMVPGLAGGKMSASDPNSKIDLLDPPDVVERKLRKAVCTPQKVEDNGVLAFVRHVIMRSQALRGGQARFEIERKGEEPLVYTEYAKLEEDFVANTVTPQTLKAALVKALNELLAPIQADFKASPEWQDVITKAYPSGAAEDGTAGKKPEKTKKDKGDPAKIAAARAARAAQKTASEAVAEASKGVEKLSTE